MSYYYRFYLAYLVVRDLCRSGCRQNYYLTPPPPPLLIFFPVHNSFFNTSDSYLKSARASSWFRCRFAVLFYILVTLRKVSRRASCKALRWDKVIMIRRVCIVNIVLYSRFIWLNGSITLIRAETERYDIVRFLRWPLSLWPRPLLLPTVWLYIRKLE